MPAATAPLTPWGESSITTHRAGRSRALRTSELDEIIGIGAARKRALLNHFGSARGVRNAALADLAAAPGVGPRVAQRIHEHFHPGAAVPARPGATAPARPGATVAPRDGTG